jgi:ParB/RepB/Spo0J family partition protein
MEMEVKMVDVDKIRPNPFQPREAFPKEEIQQLANTIRTKEIGLLQPISVRREGDTYRIISGERRWRASQFAGLSKIPAIVKDVTDSELMLQSYIENVHRKDLEPIEKGKGLAEVYKLMGFNPMKIAGMLGTIDNKIRGVGGYKPRTPLTEEEKRIKEVADMISLSYYRQREILSQLRLSPEEQKRVSELELGTDKISAIATIEKAEEREKFIEIAPKLKKEQVDITSKILKKAPEPLKKAVLDREIEPEVADKLLGVPESKMQKVIEGIKSLRLTPEEAEEHVKWAQIEPEPLFTKEEASEIERRYEELKQELDKIIQRPEVKARGKLFRNWHSHYILRQGLPNAFCPNCGEEKKGKLVWSCCNLSVEEALKEAGDKYEKG